MKQAQMKSGYNGLLNLKSSVEENVNTPDESRNAQSVSSLPGKLVLNVSVLFVFKIHDEKSYLEIRFIQYYSFFAGKLLC